MHRPQSKVLLHCERHGTLLEYSRLLNALSFFRVTPCSSLEEAKRLARSAASFDYFVHDGFDGSEKSRNDLLAFKGRIKHIVLIGGVAEDKRAAMFHWAWLNRVPLLDILSKPLNIFRLNDALSFHHEIRDVEGA